MNSFAILSIAGLIQVVLAFHFTFKPLYLYERGQFCDRVQANAAEDPYETFSPFERLLFSRFAQSVTNEIGFSNEITNYNQLIRSINSLAFDPSSSTSTVNNKSKAMLVKLFPPGLLPAYKISFGKFLPGFSAWMNTWVTWLTTQWLMGPSEVVALQKPDGSIEKENCLVIEKCRFLETSGCISTCIHACKIPTQRFFYEEMNLPVTLKPNLTELSCRFEFGVMPLPLDQDESLQHPCLGSCARPVIKELRTRNNCWKS